jgi:protein involved in polysaccharide export with SLBB domain
LIKYVGQDACNTSFFTLFSGTGLKTRVILLSWLLCVQEKKNHFPGGFFLRLCFLQSTFLSSCIYVLSLFLSVQAAPDLTEYKNAARMMPQAALDDQAAPPETKPDNSIDPATYFIGAGDVFQVSVVESPSIRYTGTVNENNDIYIPELGIVKIGKQPLTAAKKICADFVASKLKGRPDVYVSLTRMKVVNVNITGAVQTAGTQRVLGSFRLLDAIKMANLGVVPPLNDVDLRAVKCAPAGADSAKTYDLFRFLFKNDLLENPYVYGGDNVSLAFATRRVFLAGAVKSVLSGNIPIKQDEQLSEFLSFFTFEESADSGRIVVQRIEAEGKSVSRILSIRQPVDFPLKDRDLVIVSEKENYPDVYAVSISGEIARPGPYPIVKNVTRAADIIDMAGGPTSKDLLDRAYVIRRKKMLSDEAKRNLASTKPVMYGNSADNSVRAEVNSAMFRMNTTNDFVILRLSDHHEGVYLQQGDEIIVPARDHYVYVSGSVRTPGAYEYVQGKEMFYYINKAGGWSPKADKKNVSVVAYYGEIQQIKDNGVIEAGDIVVVPDSQEYKFLTVVLIPIISAAAATIATLLALASTLKR